MNSLIEVTQTVLFIPARLLGQIEYFRVVSGSGARARVLDFLAGDHDRNHRCLLENFCQSRPTRLGQHYSDLQPLHLVQDRRATCLVDHFDAYPVREFHYRHYSLHRFGQKLR